MSVIKVFLQSCSSVQNSEDLVSRVQMFFNKVRAFGTFLADGKIKSICLRSHSFFDVGKYQYIQISSSSKNASCCFTISVAFMPTVFLTLYNPWKTEFCTSDLKLK